MFTELNTDSSNVLYEVDPNGGHFFEATQVENSLNHIYSKLNNNVTTINSASDTWADDGTLLKFDQSEYIHYDQWGSPGIRTRGWLYYPNTCAVNQCKLLVWLHGGGGSAVNILETIGQIAHANNIVVLMP